MLGVVGMDAASSAQQKRGVQAPIVMVPGSEVVKQGMGTVKRGLWKLQMGWQLSKMRGVAKRFVYGRAEGRQAA
jgi:hypothetical protein